jgi:hypothetical protein
MSHILILKYVVVGSCVVESLSFRGALQDKTLRVTAVENVNL